MSRLGRGADGRAIDRAVDAIERDLELARADARLLELGAQRRQQAAGAAAMSSDRPIGSAKVKPRTEGGRGSRGSIGSSILPKRLVDAGERQVAEAAGQGRARQG